MILPRIIESLLSLMDDQGGQVFGFTVTQFTIPIMPPGARIDFTFAPTNNGYCDIVYNCSADGTMMPNVWYMDFKSGNQIMRGFLGYDSFAYGLPNFYPITRNVPAMTTLINTSPLNQFFRETTYLLTVQTVDQFYQLQYMLLKLTEQRDTKSQAKTLLAELRERGI